ncbi:hypothetical protein KUTeg_014124 [Tegillarca granosa]|uniref:Endonuclease/exonuclease/phosphatase domain-containing protein n=1 Tax=Tegillarca granosa TaxID=220873 RepID=A0ABQ9EZH9_TEGGR|nr:hypothetical protein KUTeg_014124 [Tegillarca granosa]
MDENIKIKPPKKKQRHKSNPGCTPVNAITPPWVDQLFIKIDQVDRSVNSINYKVENIATDLGSLSSRVNDVEQSVKFLSDTYDTVKITVESAKAAANEAQSEVRKFQKTYRTDMSELQKSISKISSENKMLIKENQNLKNSLTDLKCRSMHDNLIFHGIPESNENENCQNIIHDICRRHLKICDAERIVIDRAHRIGNSSRDEGPRPIVVKFNQFQQREEIQRRKRCGRGGRGGNEFNRQDRFRQRSPINRNITICKNHLDAVIWVKFDQSIFSFNKPVFIAFAHIPDIDSKFFKQYASDIFTDLEEQIFQFKELGSVFLTGDLNSRTGECSDFIEHDILNTRSCNTFLLNDSFVVNIENKKQQRWSNVEIDSEMVSRKVVRIFLDS